MNRSSSKGTAGIKGASGVVCEGGFKELPRRPWGCTNPTSTGGSAIRALYLSDRKPRRSLFMKFKLATAYTNTKRQVPKGVAGSK